MDSKLQPVQLYGFSKSRLYEPLGTAIFFRNRFCPVSWILLFLPVHFYGYSLSLGEQGLSSMEKQKIFRAEKARKALMTLRLTQCHQNWLINLAGEEGFEPSAYGFGDRRSTS